MTYRAHVDGEKMVRLERWDPLESDPEREILTDIGRLTPREARSLSALLEQRANEADGGRA